MQRIMIVGGPGSGKSTLARWVGAQTGLPVQHMDHIHWKAGWVARTTPEKLPLIRAAEAQEAWVIEGGLSATYADRAARAEVIIWLDLPVPLRLWRVLRRSVRYRGQNRPDLPQGCPEQLNAETLRFLRWIWAYRDISRNRIVDLIAAQPQGKVVHHLTSPAAVREFQSSVHI